MHATIELSDGSFAIVHESDLALVRSYRPWHVSASKGRTPSIRAYIRGSKANGAKAKWVILSHLIVGKPESGHYVDHIDGDPFNNSRANLRVVTPRQNAMNKGSKRRFKGVATSPSGKGFYSVVGVHGVPYRSRTYPTPEDAASAYNQFARHFFGEFARLNDVPDTFDALAHFRADHSARIKECQKLLDNLEAAKS
jgi:hypothetical protein